MFLGKSNVISNLVLNSTEHSNHTSTFLEDSAQPGAIPFSNLLPTQLQLQRVTCPQLGDACGQGLEVTWGFFFLSPLLEIEPRASTPSVTYTQAGL